MWIDFHTKTTDEFTDESYNINVYINIQTIKFNDKKNFLKVNISVKCK